jgi:hypothetical protein
VYFVQVFMVAPTVTRKLSVSLLPFFVRRFTRM